MEYLAEDIAEANRLETVYPITPVVHLGVFSLAKRHEDLLICWDY